MEMEDAPITTKYWATHEEHEHELEVWVKLGTVQNVLCARRCGEVPETVERDIHHHPPEQPA